MDGRHAARRSLEPVQGARASRAEDLVGASVLSLSRSFFLFLFLLPSLALIVLALSRLSLSLAPTKRVLLARALFTPRTFPFIEGACYRLYAASPCVFLSAPSLSLRLSLSLAPRLFPIRSLSHSLSLVRARARGSQSTLFRSCTHFEALGFRPYVAIVSGNRRFGNTSRREQLLIDVILPAHFEHKGGRGDRKTVHTTPH